MYYPLETRITPRITVRRERILPVRGEVLVEPGAPVTPADVVARCQLPGRLQVVDVSQALDVPRERAGRHLCKAVGSTVQAHEALAERSTRFGRHQRVCCTPVAGRIVAARLGRVLIEAPATLVELPALVRGRVVSVIPERGVVIATETALLQGVWGSGGEATGLLKLLVKDPEEALDAASFETLSEGTHYQDALVVAGWIPDERALGGAEQSGIGGLVVGGAHASLCSRLRALPFPVLITEGFGHLPMSRPAFALLRSCAGREAALNAETGTRWAAPGASGRPELLVPLDAAELLSSEAPPPPPLREGARVRGLRAPYLGVMGTVGDLPARPQVQESGARLPVAQVELDNGATAWIPLANLELLR